jgi:hypothetical protein
MMELSIRDYIYALDIDFDIDSQLDAIRYLLESHSKDRGELSEEIHRLDELSHKLEGIRNEFAVYEYIELAHHSVFLDASHSMAAVGMLAPLIETIFYRCFLGIGTKFFPINNSTNNHPRWQHSYDLFWDCHMIMAGNNWRKDLVKGIFNLSEAIDITKRWPSDLKLTLTALFAYRNKMFHNGFEWPVDERNSFKQLIANENWPDNWFSEATTDGKPWILYLSEEFIDHCLSTIDKVLDGFGGFVHDKLLEHRNQT